MAANLLSTIIFGARNVDKSLNDNVARTPVAVGQITNAVKGVAKYDKDVAKALSSFHTTSPLLIYAQKGAEFASKNINPLICVAGGVKVLCADDKKTEAINQTAALGTMFCAEKSFKALTDYKNIANAAEKLGQADKLVKVMNSKTLQTVKDKIGDKRLKILLNIAWGLSFVAASITGYNTGEKIAAKILNKEQIAKEENVLKETQNAMAQKNCQLAMG